MWLVLAILVAQGVLVWWLGERAQPVGVVASPEPALKLAVDPSALQSSPVAPQLTDPTLFALPSHQGFSGAAWLDLAPARPTPPAWAEPPLWLPPRTNELGAGLLRFLGSNKPNTAFPEAPLNSAASTADVLVFNDAVPTQSAVRIQGPLTNRPLAAPLTVSNPVYPDVLPDTVLQVRIDRLGLNESAILLQSCGVRSVDELAMAAARAARFLPVVRGGGEPAARRGSVPGWGRLVFQWFTVPPPATNITALN